MGITATCFAAYNHSIGTVRSYPSQFSIFEWSQTVYPIVDLDHMVAVGKFLISRHANLVYTDIKKKKNTRTEDIDYCPGC
jgi:hypothetical protein